jgi:hypothetical protein
MKLRRWVFRCGAVLILTALGVVVWLGFFGLHYGGMTLEQAESLVSGVPPGSSRGEVEAWLDRHLLVHEYTDGAPEFYSFQVSEAGLDRKEVGGIESGWIFHANRDPGLPNSFHLSFFFDKNGWLVKTVVLPRVTMGSR